MADRIAYVEPNLADFNAYTASESNDGSDHNKSVTLEDMCIAMNLEVEVSQRNAEVNNNKDGKNVMIMSWTNTQDKSTVNFLQGKKFYRREQDRSFDDKFAQKVKNGEKSWKDYSPSDDYAGYVNSLSTDYTEVFYHDLKDYGTSEMFGISSVDVQYDNWMVPQVSIKFVDIRGASLMAPTEMRNGDGYEGIKGLTADDIAMSMYQCFFTFPYPRFNITLKGFYGKPVSYEITCTDVRAELDSATGNFLINTKFVGYSFSFFNDISLLACIAAPYCNDYLGAKYWDDKVNSGEFTITDGNGQPTPIIKLGDLVVNYAKIMREVEVKEQSNTIISDANSKSDKITKMNNLVTAYQNFYTSMYNMLCRSTQGLGVKLCAKIVGENNLCKGVIMLLSEESVNKYANLSATAYMNKSDDDTKAALTSIDNLQAKAKAYNVLDGGDESKGMTFPKKKCSDIKAVRIVSDKKKCTGYIKDCIDVDAGGYTASQLKDFFALEDQNSTDSSGKQHHCMASVNGKHFSYAYIISYSDYGTLISSGDELTKSLEQNKDVVKDEKQRTLINALGFNPTLENVTKMFLAHFETLMYMMYKTVDDIKNQKRTADQLGTGVENLEDVPDSMKIIPPFPRVAQIKTNDDGSKKYEESWVDEFNGSVKFLEGDLIKALFNGTDAIATQVKRAVTLEEREKAAAALRSDPNADTQLSVLYPVAHFDFLHKSESPYGTWANNEPVNDVATFAGVVYNRAMQILAFGLGDVTSNSNTLSKLTDFEAKNFINKFPDIGTDVSAVLMDIPNGVKTILGIANGTNNGDNYLSNGTPWKTKNLSFRYANNSMHSPWLAPFRNKSFYMSSLAGTNLSEMAVAVKNNQLSDIKRLVAYKSMGTDIKYDWYPDVLTIDSNPARVPSVIEKVSGTDNTYKDFAYSVFDIKDEDYDSMFALNEIKVCSDMRSRGGSAPILTLPHDGEQVRVSLKLTGGTIGNGELSAVIPTGTAMAIDTDSLDTEITALGFDENGNKFYNSKNVFKQDNNGIASNPSFYVISEFPGITLDGVTRQKSLFWQKAYYNFTTVGRAALTVSSLALAIDLNTAISSLWRREQAVPRIVALWIGAMEWLALHYYWDSGLKVRQSVMKSMPSAYHVREMIAKMYRTRDASVLAVADLPYTESYRYFKYFSEWAANEFSGLFKKYEVGLDVLKSFDTSDVALKNNKVAAYLKKSNYSSVYNIVDGSGYRVSLMEAGQQAFMANIFKPVRIIRGAAIAQNDYKKGAADLKSYLHNGIKESSLNVYLEYLLKSLQTGYSVLDKSTIATQDTSGAINYVTANVPTSPEMYSSLYNYLKLVYDKWVSSCSFDEWKMADFFKEDNGDRGHGFHFVDSFYNKIGSKVYINVGDLVRKMVDAFDSNNYLTSLITFMSDVYATNRCTVLCVQNFMDLSVKDNMSNMFKPYSYNEMGKPKRHPDFVVLYTYETSSKLNTNGEYKDDSFMLDDNHKDLYPIAITSNNSSGSDNFYTIPAFGVSYGGQYQSYFKSVEIGMDKPMVTEQSLKAKFAIASQALGKSSQDGGKNQVISTGQDLFTIYSNNSYTCTLKMVGCAWVQPLMYFVLLNVPMFRGSYLIEKVSHHVEPGRFDTTVTGVRMANVQTRLNEHPFLTATNADGGDEISIESRLADITNDCPYKYYPITLNSGMGPDYSAYLSYKVRDVPNRLKASVLNSFGDKTLLDFLAAIIMEEDGTDDTAMGLHAAVMYNVIAREGSPTSKIGWKNQLRNAEWNGIGKITSETFRKERFSNAVSMVKNVFTNSPAVLVGKLKAHGEKAISFSDLTVGKNDVTLTLPMLQTVFHTLGFYGGSRPNVQTWSTASRYICMHSWSAYWKEDANTKPYWGAVTKAKTETESNTDAEELTNAFFDAVQNTMGSYNTNVDCTLKKEAMNGKLLIITQADGKTNHLSQLFDAILEGYSDYVEELVWNVKDSNSLSLAPDSVCVKVDNTTDSERTNCSIKMGTTISGSRFTCKKIISVDTALCKNFYYMLLKKYGTDSAGNKTAARVVASKDFYGDWVTSSASRLSVSDFPKGLRVVPCSEVVAAATVGNDVLTKSQFRGYLTAEPRGCHNRCKEMLKAASCSETDSMIKMVTNRGNQISGVADTSSAGVSYIDGQLVKGLPVIVSVNRGIGGHSGSDRDPCADHFIIIVGKSSNGYHYFDPASASQAKGTGSENMLSLSGGYLTGISSCFDGARYVVCSVRKNAKCATRRTSNTSTAAVRSSNGKVAIIGDSLGVGFGSNVFGLQGKSNTHAVTYAAVGANSSERGWSSAGSLNTIKSLTNASVILCFLGSNDAVGYSSYWSKIKTALDSTGKDYVWIGPAAVSGNRDYNAINNELKSVVGSHYLDIRSNVALSDGLHPTPKGYTTIKNMLKSNFGVNI